MSYYAVAQHEGSGKVLWLTLGVAGIFATIGFGGLSAYHFGLADSLHDIATQPGLSNFEEAFAKWRPTEIEYRDLGNVFGGLTAISALVTVLAFWQMNKK